MDLGPHAPFILACYAIAAMVIAAMVGWLIYDGRRQLRRISDLESRGIRRRASKP